MDVARRCRARPPDAESAITFGVPPRPPGRGARPFPHRTAAPSVPTPTPLDTFNGRSLEVSVKDVSGTAFVGTQETVPPWARSREPFHGHRRSNGQIRSK